MRGPPDRRSPATRRRDRASVIKDKVSNPSISTTAAELQPFRTIGEVVVEVVLGSLRAPTEAEQRELRAMWWSQRRLGHTLPAERGLIQLDGGRQ